MACCPALSCRRQARHRSKRGAGPDSQSAAHRWALAPTVCCCSCTCLVQHGQPATQPQARARSPTHLSKCSALCVLCCAALPAELDGFEGRPGVLLLAATNRPGVLDSALMRPGRLSRKVRLSRHRSNAFVRHGCLLPSCPMQPCTAPAHAARPQEITPTPVLTSAPLPCFHPLRRRRRR